MAYATQQDLVDRFGSDELIALTDLSTPRTGSINATRVADALADAEARINGYLGSRYTLPLATVPNGLKAMTCDIARYLLQGAATPTEDARKRFDDAISFLRDVSKGVASLGIGDTQTAPAPDDAADYTGNDRVFSPDTLADY